MKTSETITKIAPALLKVQKSMGVITKDATNPYFNSVYADINSVLAVALETLNENGISVLQPVSTENGKMQVETMLLHESGEYVSDKFELVLTKQDMQALGSAITYARRYGIQSTLGMRAQDDDGNASVSRSPEAPRTFKPNLPAAAAKSPIVTKVTSTPTSGSVSVISDSTVVQNAKPVTATVSARPNFKARVAAKPAAAPAEDNSGGLG